METILYSRLPLTRQVVQSQLRGGVRGDTLLEGVQQPDGLRPSPLKSAYQTRRAQIAPPEVPLRATISYRSSFSARSRLSTPAEKSEWLPPLWHAIVTRFVSRSPSTSIIIRGVPRRVTHAAPPLFMSRRSHPGRSLHGASCRDSAREASPDTYSKAVSEGGELPRDSREAAEPFDANRKLSSRTQGVGPCRLCV